MKKAKSQLLIIGIVLILLIGAIITTQYIKNKRVDTTPQENINIDRYMGLWYETARHPNFFERNCDCVTAEYEVIDEDSISIKNTCKKTNGELSTITGVGYIDDSTIYIDFDERYMPTTALYNIVYVDNNYDNAIVASSHNRFWILSRNPSALSQEEFSNLQNILSDKGFDTSDMIVNLETCEI